MDVAWFQSRYDKTSEGGDGKDYINCPLNKSQYDSFIEALWWMAAVHICVFVLMVLVMLFKYVQK